MPAQALAWPPRLSAGRRESGSQRPWLGEAALRKAFFTLLAILWKSAFKWVYHSFCPLLFTSLLFTAVCMWDFPRPGIKRVSCIASQILNHWTTREVPLVSVHFPGAFLCSSRQPYKVRRARRQTPGHRRPSKVTRPLPQPGWRSRVVALVLG